MLGWGLKARAAARCEGAGGRKRKKMCWRVVLTLWQFCFVCFGMDVVIMYGGSSEWAYRGVIDGPRAFFLSVVSDTRLFTMNI